MKYWRMAMRDGEEGRDRFPDCKQRGIAALDYYRDKSCQIRYVDDCRNLTKESYIRLLHGKISVSGYNSLLSLWSKMKVGDVIYARSAPLIVGKGIVTSGYEFDPDILKGAAGPKWAHFVRVKWDDIFIPFIINFGENRLTLREIKGEELKNLLNAEKAAGDKG